MGRIQNRWLIGLLVILGVGLVACGPSQEEVQAQAEQEQFEAVEQLKQELDAARNQLAELRERAAAAAAEAGDDAAEAAEEGAEAVGETAEELAAQVAQLESEVLDKANDFGQKLVEYINSQGLAPGEPMTETQLAAIRMKSSEDMVLAREYIEKGGDYKRAIRIYTEALDVDPDNPDLQAALAEAEELRFMSPERFAAVKKGMSEDEVRELLGQVNLRNIREYPDRGVVAWFYPTSEGGTAAAVYFREANGEQAVYRTVYEAVEPGSGGSEG